MNKSKFDIKEYLKKLSEEEGQTFPEIVNGINKGTIKIEPLGHNYIRMGDKNIEYFKKEMNNLLDQRKKSAKRLPDNPITQGKLYEKIKPGEADTDMEIYCWDCGARMYGILIDENIWSFIPSGKYWELCDTKSNKYEAILTKEDIKSAECPLHKELGNERKLVTEIEVPSGELIFANYFENKETYESKEYDSINDLSGQFKLMKYLADKDIGYGQMGNMSVAIYSDNKNNVIIGSDLELYHDNKHYHDNNPDTIDDKWKKEMKDAEAFKEEIKGYKEFGKISLDVWRWQCGDKKILEEKYGEKFPKDMKKNEKGNDFIWIGVEPGTWVIEHYYDFPENGDYLYSKLYKK